MCDAALNLAVLYHFEKFLLSMFRMSRPLRTLIGEEPVRWKA